MGFSFEGAARSPELAKVTAKRGDEGVGGLVQYCDRCRGISEFRRFYRPVGNTVVSHHLLTHIECIQCQKVYYIYIGVDCK